MRAHTSRMLLKLSSSSITMPSTSSVSQSRTTRSQRSGSWKMQQGVRRCLMLPCISFQMLSRFLRSWANALALAPWPTVRTTRPTFSGSGNRSRICLSRLRSAASPIFLDTPRTFVPGIITRYRPGMDRLAVMRGPLVEMGPFVTWTMISRPGGKRLAISSLESRLCLFLFRPPPLRPSSSSSMSASTSGTMSQ